MARFERRGIRPSNSSIEIPVTVERALSFFADGKESPVSHPQTVGCDTPMRRASSVCVIAASTRYCLSLSTPPNIGDSYTASIGRTYCDLNHTPGVRRNPQKRTVWQRVKEALREAGRPDNQTEAARIAKVKQPSVSDWNKPDGYPTIAAAVLLAEELNICVEWIYTEREPKRPGPPSDEIAQELWSFWKDIPKEKRRDLLGWARLHRLPAAAPDTPEAVPQRTTPPRSAGSPRPGR